MHKQIKKMTEKDKERKIVFNKKNIKSRYNQHKEKTYLSIYLSQKNQLKK